MTTEKMTLTRRLIAANSNLAQAHLDRANLLEVGLPRAQDREDTIRAIESHRRQARNCLDYIIVLEQMPEQTETLTHELANVVLAGLYASYEHVRVGCL